MRIEEKLHIYKNNTQTDFDLYSDKTTIPNQSNYLSVVTEDDKVAYCPIATSKTTTNALAIRKGSTTYYTVKVNQLLTFTYYCKYDEKSSSCSNQDVEDLYVTKIELNQYLDRDICIKFSSEDGESKVFTITAGNLTATISNTYVLTNYRDWNDGDFSFFYEVYYPSVTNYATAVINTRQESRFGVYLTEVDVGYWDIVITNPFSEDNTLPEYFYIYTKVNTRDWQALTPVKSSTTKSYYNTENMALTLLWYTIKYKYVYNGKTIATKSMSLGPNDLGIASPTHTIKIPVETVSEKVTVVSKTAITYTESSTKISKSIEI